MVGIGFKNKKTDGKHRYVFKCAGVMVSKRHIVTSASCALRENLCGFEYIVKYFFKLFELPFFFG